MQTLKYPEDAKQNDYRDRVNVRFVVNTESTISNIEILNDIGGGCGQAAEQVLESMNSLPEKWISGKQLGIKVNVGSLFLLFLN